VFWKYYKFRDLTPLEMILLPVLSVLLAAAMYRFVEQPFRRFKETSLSGSGFGLACALLSLLIVIPAANAWANKGWSWRLPPELYQSLGDMTSKRKEYWGDWKGNVRKPSDFSPARLSVVVIGDSFALDVVNMIRLTRGLEVYYDGTTGYNCRGFVIPAKRCAVNKKKFQTNYEGAEVVVLADQGSTWGPTADSRETAAMLRNVNLLRHHGFKGPVVIYGERPRYSNPVYQIVLRFGRLAGAGRYASESLMVSEAGIRERIETAKTFYESHNLHYFSPVPQLCRDEWCDVLTPSGKQIYFDTMHFTLDGVQHLKAEFADYLRSL